MYQTTGAGPPTLSQRAKPGRRRVTGRPLNRTEPRAYRVRGTRSRMSRRTRDSALLIRLADPRATYADFRLPQCGSIRITLQLLVIGGVPR